MIERTSSATDLQVGHGSVRERTINAVTAIIPASIAIPLILRTWTPTWFALTWLAIYVAVSAGFLVLLNVRHTNYKESAWSLCVSALFSVIPLSVVVWSGDTADFFAAATVAMIFIAFEVSALPFLDAGHWRGGFVMVGAALTISGVFSINPIIALAVPPVLYAIVRGATRMQRLKNELEELLAAAERTML